MDVEGSDRTLDAPGEAEPADAKPRGAASLTADIVARGRHRTQEYGEAGLWRGSQAPPPSEAPVRVVFPPAPGEAPKPKPEASQPAETTQRTESVTPTPPPPAAEEPVVKGPTEELVPLMLLSVALFLAVFVIGVLFF